MTRMGAFVVMNVLLAFTGVEQSLTTADCTGTITTLLPCLSFVSGEVASPPLTCCAVLKLVVVDSPACLCLVLGTGQTIARTLPGLCSVSANEEDCAALLGEISPVPSPSASPASGPGADGRPSSDLAPGASPSSSATTSSTSLAVVFSGFIVAAAVNF